VKTVYIENGEASLDKLLGIDAASEERIDAVHNHHDHHHAHGEHHEHAHDHFDSFVVKLGEVSSDLLQEALEQLIEEHNIFRVKGFAAVHGKPMRQVFQAVGRRLDRYFDRLWQAEEVRQTQLVFIGKGIDKKTIEGALNDALSA
jgi:cobalamin biosynthesis protein CobW